MTMENKEVTRLINTARSNYYQVLIKIIEQK